MKSTPLSTADTVGAKRRTTTGPAHRVLGLVPLVPLLLSLVLAASGIASGDFSLREEADREWDCGPCDRGNIHGSHPYAWILLRFADYDTTPRPKEWFEGQALGGYPSLDHLWRELSYGSMNIEGSIVVGWYDLPEPLHAYMVNDSTGQAIGPNCEKTIDHAVALADPEVDFSTISGFHMIFNADLPYGNVALGGTVEYEIDGVPRCFGVTWIPAGWQDQGIMAHEMGHTFGLGHSGVNDTTFGAQWDLMCSPCGQCNYDDPVYGKVPIHTIAYHKNRLGWIHPDHKYLMSNEPTVASILLHDLAGIPPAGRYLMAEIPSLYDASVFYTAECRKWSGYDQALPAETTVLHEVIPTRVNHAWIIDGDGDEDPNDEGARWEPGEYFFDESRRIIITIEEEDGETSRITATNAAKQVVYADELHQGYEDGTALYPWDTIFEGYGAVFPDGELFIVPGNYPEELTFSKPATLQRYGNSGEVVIGE